MPFQKISDAPNNIRKLRPSPDKDPIPLTLPQINKITEVADALVANQGFQTGQAMATAINQFKKRHRVENGNWVLKRKRDDNSSMQILGNTAHYIGRDKYLSVTF